MMDDGELNWIGLDWIGLDWIVWDWIVWMKGARVLAGAGGGGGGGYECRGGGRDR